MPHQWERFHQSTCRRGHARSARSRSCDTPRTCRTCSDCSSERCSAWHAVPPQPWSRLPDPPSYARWRTAPRISGTAAHGRRAPPPATVRSGHVRTARALRPICRSPPRIGSAPGPSRLDSTLRTTDPAGSTGPADLPAPVGTTPERGVHAWPDHPLLRSHAGAQDRPSSRATSITHSQSCERGPLHPPFTPVAPKSPSSRARSAYTPAPTGSADRVVPGSDDRGHGSTGRTWNTWDLSRAPSLISDYDGIPTPYGIGLRDHPRAPSTAEETEFA